MRTHYTGNHICNISFNPPNDTKCKYYSFRTDGKIETQRDAKALSPSQTAN